MSELLPCPFCGGEARIEQHEKGKWLAFCDDVYGCGTEGWYESTPEEAIAAWNRRTPTIPPDVRETLQEVLEWRKQWMKATGDQLTVNSIDEIDAALAWLDALDAPPFLTAAEFTEQLIDGMRDVLGKLQDGE